MKHLPEIIFHEVDCMEYLPSIPDNEFQVGCVDPPWGVGASKPNLKNDFVTQKDGSKLPIKLSDYGKENWDDEPATAEYGAELFRVSVNQIIWGANFFDWIVDEPFKPPRRNEFAAFIEKYPRGWIIWDKLNGESDQWDCELAWTSFDRPTVIYEYMWHGMMQGSQTNGKVQEGNKRLNEKRIHPTQKPTKLYRWILQEYAKVGDKILDTHLGSFSIAVACYIEGFDLVGMENNPSIFKKGLNFYKSRTTQTIMRI